MRFSEYSSFVSNVDETVAFYERLLGKLPAHRQEGFAFFDCDGVKIIVHKTYVQRPEDPPCESHAGFAVDDLDQSIKELQLRGLQLEIPPRTFPWGRSAYLRDPSGALLELSENQRL